jgi:CheY-like chemotaxis protein
MPCCQQLCHSPRPPLWEGDVRSATTTTVTTGFFPVLVILDCVRGSWLLKMGVLRELHFHWRESSRDVSMVEKEMPGKTSENLDQLAKVAAGRTRILVIEDDFPTAAVLRFKLERAGFAVGVAQNGRLACELVRRESFDLVIADEIMPEMSGLEFCRHFRGTAAGREVPIILLTAKNLELDHVQIRRDLQISRILGKPFSPKAVVQEVKAVLQGAAQTVPA